MDAEITVPFVGRPQHKEMTMSDAWKARAEELEAKLAKALSIACELSGCVEYDYHGNVMGHGTRKAMAELDKLL